MPRNASGAYNLPNPPVLAGTTILDTDENATRDDIAAELTNSLDRNGRGGMLAPFKIFDGTMATPGLAFLTAPSTGMYQAGANIIGFAANGADVLRLSSSPLAVNYLNINASAAGQPMTVTAVGSDANISINLVPKGTGVVNLPAVGVAGFADGTVALPSISFTSDPDTGIYHPSANNVGIVGAGAEQVRVIGVAGAVDFLTFRGTPAGNYPTLVPGGASADVGIIFDTKGTGGLQFRTGNASNIQVIIPHVGSAVNYWQLQGAVAGGVLTALAQGASADIGFLYTTKGAGGHSFATNGSGLNIQFRVTHIASAVNFISVQGAAAAGAPYILTTGSDTNIPLFFATKGSGSYAFTSNTGAETQFRISSTVGAVNYCSVQGSTTANAVPIIFTGTDANVHGYIGWKGLGSLSFYSNTDSGIRSQFRINSTPNAVNMLAASGAATGQRPSIQAFGTDADVGVNIVSKGAGSTVFYSHDNVPQMLIGGIAGAVNYWRMQGSQTNNSLLMGPEGSDANIHLTLYTKGNGSIAFHSNTAVTRQFIINATAGAVNHFQVTGNVTGNPPYLEAVGSDANINTAFVTKGSGVYAFYTNGGASWTPQLFINHTPGSTRAISVVGSAAGDPVLSTSASGLTIWPANGQTYILGGNNTGGISGPPTGTWALRVVMNQDANLYSGLSVQQRWSSSTTPIAQFAAGWNGTSVGYFPSATWYADGAFLFKTPSAVSSYLVGDNGGRILTGGTGPAAGYTNSGDISMPVNGRIRAQNTAKVWGFVTVSAPTLTVLASWNVASITRHGVGDYTINFANAFSDNLYSFTATASQMAAGQPPVIVVENLDAPARNAGSHRIYCLRQDTGGPVDPQYFNFTYHGN